jgi:monoamine oxidase
VGDPALLAVVASAGVEVKRARPARGLATVAYARAERHRYGAEDDPPERHALSSEETRLGFKGCLEKYFPEAHGWDPATAWPAGALASADAKTGAELLAARGASPGYVASCADFVYSDMHAVSGAFLVRDVAGFVQDLGREGGGRIVGGSDLLPAAVARGLGDRILYGAEVRRIRVDERGVTVSFTRKGEEQTFEAERVVCAVPYGALRRVELPRLSAAKERAIRELVSVPVTRVYAEVDRRVWTERGERGDAESDLPLGDLLDETKTQEGKAGVIGAYLSGDRARAAAGKREADLVAALVDDAEKVHPGVRAAFRAGAAKNWEDDPFARGAYAWLRAGEMVAFVEALAAPEGRLHFAGDHTSHRPGWMHGAVASAKRVVREIEDPSGHARAPRG